jgi:hypothetical protein
VHEVEDDNEDPDDLSSNTLTPSHCIWEFEDLEGRVHVGFSMVMPSLVGLNTCQLEPKADNDRMSLRVKMKMIHPKSWTQTKFHKKAHKKEKIPPTFILLRTYWMVKNELDKLAKLSKSKMRDKIKTFCYFKLPVAFKLDLLYQNPIHHRETGVFTYILVLHKLCTKDDKAKRKKDKSVQFWS